MPYVLEKSSEGHKFAQGKAIVVNSMSGKHFSNLPIPIERARAQMRLLQAVDHGMVPRHK